VRLQKHLATSSASQEDLTTLLGRAPGTAEMLRALQEAHKQVHNPAVTAEMEKQCCIIAAKIGVLLKCRLISTTMLMPAAEAVALAAELILLKDSRIRPAGVRLLPSAVAVDNADPFHMEVASSIRGVGSSLSRTVCAHLSESSGQMLNELFSALGSQALLAVLFGNAMRPAAGIPAKGALERLLPASRQYIAWRATLVD